MGRKKRRAPIVEEPVDPVAAHVPPPINNAHPAAITTTTAAAAVEHVHKKPKVSDDQAEAVSNIISTGQSTSHNKNTLNDADADLYNLYDDTATGDLKSSGGNGVGVVRADGDSVSNKASGAGINANDYNNEDNYDGDVAALIGDEYDHNKNRISSGYSIHTNSGEYETIDIYVSDGSEDEEDFEVILTNSRFGVMRRGGGLILSSMMQNKQWIRGENSNGEKNDEIQKEEEENLDPSVKAARELAEKRRQLDMAKEEARRKESAENAGRDPCLFSKRTAFDIRMDQIDDKPWYRGDITDFFNYGLAEEDWVDYAERQITVRQELTDAVRQKRQPDPNIVPVEPRAPAKQNPKVAVNRLTKSETESSNDNGSNVIGPEKPATCIIIDDDKNKPSIKEEEVEDDIAADSIGGAWGGDAVPGSKLAKLIEEQEAAMEKEQITNGDISHLPMQSKPDYSRPPPPPPPPPPPHFDSRSQKPSHLPLPPPPDHGLHGFDPKNSYKNKRPHGENNQFSVYSGPPPQQNFDRPPPGPYGYSQQPPSQHNYDRPPPSNQQNYDRPPPNQQNFDRPPPNHQYGYDRPPPGPRGRGRGRDRGRGGRGPPGRGGRHYGRGMPPFDSNRKRSWGEYSGGRGYRR